MPSAPKITVHHLQHSRSERIIWLLEELELQYEINVVERDPKTLLAPKEARDIHPLGKFPVVTIEENGETTVLAESGAILEYIIQTYAKDKFSPAPDNKKERAEYLYWMHFSEGSLMNFLVFALVCDQIPKQGPWLAYPLTSAVAYGIMKSFVQPNINASFKVLNDALEKSAGPWLLGSRLTGADFIMLFPIAAYAARGMLKKDFPACQRWLDQVKQRDAFKRLVEKIGPIDEVAL